MQGFSPRLLPLMAGLLALLLLGSCVSYGQPQVPGPKVGSPAPDFTLETLEGGKLTLSQLRGKVVLVNFFATWCPACRAEMPFLQGAWEAQRDQGVEVLIVDIQEDQGIVADFMRQNGYTMPVVMDREGRVSATYKVTSLPTSFILDREGIVRAVQVGAFPSQQAVLSRLAKLK